jgi:hypothetical protein
MDKIKKNKKLIPLFIYLILIFSFAAILRFYHLSFFEFNNDQLHAILLGNDARVHHFLITHGMNSGVGFNNPPFFIYLMGVLTYFSNDPYFLTAFFTILNLLVLAMAFWYFCSFLPIKYAVLLGTLLAFSPAFTMYSSNIWAQCTFPLFMILFHFCFYKFIKEGVPLYFIMLNLLAGAAAQMHMSGFFLFPAILVLGFKYKSVIKKKHLALVAILLFFMYLPYLYHLFGEGELKRVLVHAKGDNDIPWNIFRSHIWFVSLDFFRRLFRGEFLSVLNHSLGISGLILYPFTYILPALFVFGFYSYIKFLIREKSLFKKDSDTEPLPFQISGFLVVVITLGYLVFQVRTPLHYLIVLFPGHAIITAFAAWKLWKYKAVRIATVISVIVTTALVVAVLRFLDAAGGHWCQYGPSYKFLKDLKGRITLLTQGKLCPDLRLVLPKTGKFDEAAIRFVLLGDHPCKNDAKHLPIKLSIAWDDETMHYVYTLTNGE